MNLMRRDITYLDIFWQVAKIQKTLFFHIVNNHFNFLLCRCNKSFQAKAYISVSR